MIFNLAAMKEKVAWIYKEGGGVQDLDVIEAQNLDVREAQNLDAQSGR